MASEDRCSEQLDQTRPDPHRADVGSWATSVLPHCTCQGHLTPNSRISCFGAGPIDELPHTANVFGIDWRRRKAVLKLGYEGSKLNIAHVGSGRITAVLHRSPILEFTPLVAVPGVSPATSKLVVFHV